MVVVSLSTSGVDANWTDGGNPFKPPPKGLEPIGDSGWYSSPQDLLPGDRQYCEYNSGSPVCGGNPFTKDGLGIDVEVNVDPCGFSARVGGAIAFVKMPETQITYRKPGECRREYEQPDPPPDMPPIPEEYQPPPSPPQLPGDIPLDAEVVMLFGMTSVDYRTLLVKSTGAITTELSVHQTTKAELYYPSTRVYKNDLKGHIAESTFEWEEIDKYTTSYSGTGQRIEGLIEDVNPELEKLSGYDFKIVNSHASASTYGTIWFHGTYGDIKRYWRTKKTLETSTETYDTSNTTNVYNFWIAWYPLVYRIILSNDYSKNPPPQPDSKECCMQCCSSTPNNAQQEDNNDLLRQILAECKKANQRIGSDLFPASFPSKLTGNSSSTVTLNNLAEMHKQQVMYLDEVVGEYPVKVRIEDTDATTEGNQSQTLEFGNTSELLAEAFGVLMSLAIDSNTLVQLSTKNLIETGITRKQVHTMQSVLDALIAHTGFERKEEVEDVPFTFTVPNAANTKDMTLSDFCKESTQKVEVMKYTGKTTYEEDRAIIRHAHGILKSVFWRGVAKDAANVGLAIRDIIKKQNDAANKIATGTGEDLDNWAEDFEMGFTSYTGGTTTRDPAKPYGLDLTQRPRVQIIHKPGQLPPTT